MPVVQQAQASSSESVSAQPLAARMAMDIAKTRMEDLPGAVVEKLRTCLFDLIGCAFEARQLPWSRQSIGLAQSVDGAGANIFGQTGRYTYGDAAFANGVMGHGLVREDMHSGSISHLGVVVLPVLLALAQDRRFSGAQFIAAAAVGYEVGGQIGRAVVDAAVARIHRPTGICGPLAGAAAGAHLLGLAPAQITSALALGANTTLGFNQWAHTGGSEMYFQVGFAARNAVSAARLAEAGAFASPSALDGEAGLFASLGKLGAEERVVLFASLPEILSVYHKPVPACNFAQTPCQAALRIAAESAPAVDRIVAIEVLVPKAGKAYPGCDSSGPFDHVLQAKMSIQYNVAAALLTGRVDEANFELLRDARLHRLIGLTSLIIDEDMTQAYPAEQGAEVRVRESDGTTHRVRLADVVNASPEAVRLRFMAALEQGLGVERAGTVAAFIDRLEHAEDVGQLAALTVP